MTTTCIILIVIITSLAQINGETSQVKKNPMKIGKGTNEDSEDSINSRCNRDLFNMFDMDHDGKITMKDLENCGKKESEYMKIEIDGWDANTKNNILKNMKDITGYAPCNGQMDYNFFNNGIMRFLEMLDPLTSEQEADMNFLRGFQLSLKECYTLEEVAKASKCDVNKVRQRYGLGGAGLNVKILRKDLVSALRNNDHLPPRPITIVWKNIAQRCSIARECLARRHSILKDNITAKALELKKRISGTGNRNKPKRR
ncbi:uncharacterized protein LOC111055810 [Nilaparvata lugens]|uniref:uncharacterized protein LOC111055810 n=1 Tax=Nilaparvata lugens TaxID=108931 RepID=UPI00193DA7A8|nr:uncharacterized protein LOC111055810 [Nilaparvata lugens]